MSREVPAWQPMAESVAVVVLLAAGLTALFLSLPNPGMYDPGMLHAAGGLASDVVWSEPWRLLSATWLHADWDHLIGNIVMMLIMSVLLTRALGWDRYVLLYLGAGLAGSLASAIFEVPSLNVGASGAVYGLTGATVAYALRPRRVLHELEVHAVREAMLPIAGIQLLFSFLPGVSWGAHLGGFFFGFAAALTGLLDLGLPHRAAGTRHPPVRWTWVVASTTGVLVLGCCTNNLMTVLLLLLYVVVLVVSGRSGPDWRPDLYPSVMLAAVGALALNGLAVGVALVRGAPWDAVGGWRPDVDGLPPGLDVAMPGGLGPIWIPEVLAHERTGSSEAGRSVTRFGSRDDHPFALRVSVGDLADPVTVVREVRTAHGDAVEFAPGDLDGACPWLGWSTREHSGMVVFTGKGAVEVQLERWSRPLDPAWTEAEDAVVEQFYALDDCEASPWSEGELGLGLREAELGRQALRLLDRQLDEAPEDHQLRLTRAELSLTDGTCQAALIDFDRLKRVLPREGRVWTGLARATLECGPSREDLLTAEESAERAVDASPESPAAWEVLGEVRVSLGMRESAEEAMLQAAALVPGGPERERLLDRAAKARRGFRVRDRVGD